jgi:Uma2 family endonuclease
MHSPVNFRHARLLNFLHHLMDLYVQHKRLDEVHREVIAVRLSSRNVFLPDLACFTAEQVGRLAESHAPFAPALVVEALSPWSADRDVGPKFAAYEEHGVQEYWVLDPDTRAHRFYRRQGEELVEFAVGEPLIRAQAIPGFWVRREWLNADPLPAAAPCLEEVLAARA